MTIHLIKKNVPLTIGSILDTFDHALGLTENHSDPVALTQKNPSNELFWK